MSREHDAVRRSLNALRPGDADTHPGEETLEAYVEGRLTAEERAAVDRLAARSKLVAEDIADLRAVREALATQPAARRDIRWNRVAIVAAVAATIVAVIWIAAPTRVQAPTRRALLVGDENAQVQAAIDSGRIPLPSQLAALRPAPGTLLGTVRPATFALRGPVGSFVSSTNPVLTWDDAAADSYTVAVFDQNFNEVAHGEVKGTVWQVTSDLARGATYSWQVTAHRGSATDTEPRPPRPEARFRVVDEATANLAKELTARLDATDPLPLGILLAEHGLIAEAREHLIRASRIPGSADAAMQLLASLDQGTPTTTKPAQ